MNTKAAEAPLQSGGAAAGAPVNSKADASQRAKSRSLKPLRRLMPFLFRYPMLSWQDHPQPFVYRYAFKIVK